MLCMCLPCDEHVTCDGNSNSGSYTCSWSPSAYMYGSYLHLFAGLSLAVRSDVIPVQFVPLSAYIVG